MIKTFGYVWIKLYMLKFSTVKDEFFDFLNVYCKFQVMLKG